MAYLLQPVYIRNSKGNENNKYAIHLYRDFQMTSILRSRAMGVLVTHILMETRLYPHNPIEFGILTIQSNNLIRRKQENEMVQQS